MTWFPSQEACVEYLERVRWPDGFVCPDCEHHGGWKASRGRWVCGGCRRQTTVTAGTALHGTRTPLAVWMAVVWEMTGDKTGISAMSIYKEWGFGSYETAWAWLHKLRRSMVVMDRSRLAGIVEVDETYVGGYEEGVTGRETNTKSIVVVAVERRRGRNGPVSGRVRLGVVPDVSFASLYAFIEENIEPGTLIVTDAWSGYKSLNRKAYEHQAINVSRSGKKAHEVLPLVHRHASLLKRWLLGRHQGAVSPANLDYYLDEYVFRFNRRSAKHRGLLFYRLVQQAVRTDPSPLPTLLSPEAKNSSW